MSCALLLFSAVIFKRGQSGKVISQPVILSTKTVFNIFNRLEMRFLDLSPCIKARLYILQSDTSEHLSPFTALILFETRALNILQCGIEVICTVSIQITIITVIAVSIVKALGILLYKIDQVHSIAL